MLPLDPNRLLPPNACKFEIDVISVVVNGIERIYADIKVLANSKINNPNSPLLPYIIREYGFGAVSKYIPMNDEFISEGIKWKRDRGTPAAVTRAFDWIFRDDELIEQSIWWHWTMVEVRIIGDIPDREGLRDIITLVRESLPARSKLARIWSGEDCAMVTLNESYLNESTLNVPCGIWDEEFGLWLKLQAKKDETFICPRGSMTDHVYEVVSTELRKPIRLNDCGYLNNPTGPSWILEYPEFKDLNVTLADHDAYWSTLISLDDENILADIHDHMLDFSETL
jgi:hypothetical protein